MSKQNTTKEINTTIHTRKWKEKKQQQKPVIWQGKYVGKLCSKMQKLFVFGGWNSLKTRSNSVCRVFKFIWLFLFFRLVFSIVYFDPEAKTKNMQWNYMRYQRIKLIEWSIIGRIALPFLVVVFQRVSTTLCSKQASQLMLSLPNEWFCWIRCVCVKWIIHRIWPDFLHNKKMAQRLNAWQCDNRSKRAQLRTKKNTKQKRRGYKNSRYSVEILCTQFAVRWKLHIDQK